VYAWLNPGTSLTLYLDAAGKVEYVFVGGGTGASAAIIVYEKGSTKASTPWRAPPHTRSSKTAWR
jgi:hypothetical protein